MIISASRRTDIPALYSKWFINRIRAGWCQVPNPLNYNQLSYVSLKPDDVDAIVFWTKNPTPMFTRLDELNSFGFRYYFQFAINDYPYDFEPRMPPLKERLNIFQKLSFCLEPKRVIWRYDPIVVSNKTNFDFHREKFSNIARELNGFTKRVVVSFVDYYRKTDRRLSTLEEHGYRFNRRVAKSRGAWNLLRDFSAIAQDHNMEIFTCAEERNFSKVGVHPGSCIDGELLRKLWSLQGFSKKDPTQRSACLCVVSKDIGMNDTCINGCKYCYATRNLDLAQRRYSEHDPNSPVLWGNHRELSEKEQANQLKVRLI
ncbi:DUF1848 domain-containing protein [Chloroflexota bacterium]